MKYKLQVDKFGAKEETNKIITTTKNWSDWRHVMEFFFEDPSKRSLFNETKKVCFLDMTVFGCNIYCGKLQIFCGTRCPCVISGRYFKKQAQENLEVSFPTLSFFLHFFVSCFVSYVFVSLFQVDRSFLWKVVLEHPTIDWAPKTWNLTYGRELLAFGFWHFKVQCQTLDRWFFLCALQSSKPSYGGPRTLWPWTLEH